MGLLLVFTGRKRDWMRNLNGKNMKCFPPPRSPFSSCHPGRSQCKGKSLAHLCRSTHSVGMV